MGFSRQEYWSGLPFPSPEDLPHPGIEPGSPALQADSLPSELLGSSLSKRNDCKYAISNVVVRFGIRESALCPTLGLNF